MNKIKYQRRSQTVESNQVMRRTCLFVAFHCQSVLASRSSRIYTLQSKPWISRVGPIPTNPLTRFWNRNKINPNIATQTRRKTTYLFGGLATAMLEVRTFSLLWSARSSSPSFVFGWYSFVPSWIMFGLLSAPSSATSSQRPLHKNISTLMRPGPKQNLNKSSWSSLDGLDGCLREPAPRPRPSQRPEDQPHSHLTHNA